MEILWPLDLQGISRICIGFLVFKFWSLQKFSFILFIIISLIIISKLYFVKNLQSGLLFVILALSNPYLFFENLEPIDYSWALFFFTLGLYFRKIEKLDLLRFFAISIGTRINLFLLFCSNIFYNYEKNFYWKI